MALVDFISLQSVVSSYRRAEQQSGDCRAGSKRKHAGRRMRVTVAAGSNRPNAGTQPSARLDRTVRVLTSRVCQQTRLHNHQRAQTHGGTKMPGFACARQFKRGFGQIVRVDFDIHDFLLLTPCFRLDVGVTGDWFSGRLMAVGNLRKVGNRAVVGAHAFRVGISHARSTR